MQNPDDIQIQDEKKNSEDVLKFFSARYSISLSSSDSEQISIQLESKLPSNDFEVFKLMQAKVIGDEIDAETPKEAFVQGTDGEIDTDEPKEELVQGSGLLKSLEALVQGADGGIDTDEPKEELVQGSDKEALVQGSGFLKSFNSSSILDVDPASLTEDQRHGMQTICHTVAVKLKYYDGIKRTSVLDVPDKVPKPLTKGGKLLQLLIKKQRNKPGFKLLLQEIVNEFMPYNHINIEDIFTLYHIDPKQMVDMYIISGRLIIQTNDRELTFNSEGEFEHSCKIRRGFFGTIHRIDYTPLVQPQTVSPTSIQVQPQTVNPTSIQAQPQIVRPTFIEVQQPNPQPNLQQAFVDEMMPGNKINMENIFAQNNIDPNQIVTVRVKGDNLIIKTKNEKFTFDRNGVRVDETQQLDETQQQQQPSLRDRIEYIRSMADQDHGPIVQTVSPQQALVNKMMPNNNIDMEDIFKQLFKQYNISPDQILNMHVEHVEGDNLNLVITTKNKEFTFDKSGSLVSLTQPQQQPSIRDRLEYLESLATQDHGSRMRTVSQQALVGKLVDQVMPNNRIDEDVFKQYSINPDQIVKIQVEDDNLAIEIKDEKFIFNVYGNLIAVQFQNVELLQAFVNKIMPVNKIKMEDILKNYSINLGQRLDIHVEYDNLVIRTKDEKFTFDKNGVVKEKLTFDEKGLLKEKFTLDGNGKLIKETQGQRQQSLVDRIAAFKGVPTNANPTPSEPSVQDAPR